MSYTLREAARLVGVSVRTLRRRIAEGDLPTSTDRRGPRDVTVIDPGDLAAWAQAQGYTMATPQGTQGQEAQTGAGPYDTDRQAPPSAPGQATAGPGQGEGNGAAEGATGAELQWRVRALEAQVRALEGERDFLRQALATAQRTLEQATKALPEPQVSPDRKPGWWARLTGRG